VFIGPAVGMGLDLYTRNHDPLTFITPDSRSQPQIGGIPVGMVMNMNSMAPRFFNQQSVQSKYFLNIFNPFCIPILSVNGWSFCNCKQTCYGLPSNQEHLVRPLKI